MAKHKRLKTVQAGRLVFGVCYTQATASDTPKARAAKTKCSSEARKRLNFRSAWQKLQLLLCCNFGSRDHWVTLTYDDAHLPNRREEAKKDIQKLIDKLRTCWRKAGTELKYVYVIEELVDDGQGRRLHFHLVINSTGSGRDYEAIRSLWQKGSNIEIKPLCDEAMFADDFLELAQYLCKERNPEAGSYNTGDRCWCSSLNLSKPEVTSELVEDNVTITAPPGARVIDSDHKQNEFGCYDYIVYLLPDAPPKRPPKSKEGLSSF